VHPQNAGSSLLAIASSDLKSGRIEPAFAIYDGLSKSNDFLMKGDAILGLATAQGWLPSPDSLNNKKQTLEGLLNDKGTCKEGTTFQANVLTELAKTFIPVRQYDQAYRVLEKATAIYFDQGEHKRREVAIHLQGALEVVKGNFDVALQKISDAATYGMIEIPSFVPTWLTSESTTDKQIEHTSAVALATSSPN